MIIVSISAQSSEIIPLLQMNIPKTVLTQPSPVNVDPSISSAVEGYLKPLLARKDTDKTTSDSRKVTTGDDRSIKIKFGKDKKEFFNLGKDDKSKIETEHKVEFKETSTKNTYMLKVLFMILIILLFGFINQKDFPNPYLIMVAVLP